jgi:hypothetical protein
MMRLRDTGQDNYNDYRTLLQDSPSDADKKSKKKKKKKLEEKRLPYDEGSSGDQDEDNRLKRLKDRFVYSTPILLAGQYSIRYLVYI